MIRNRNMGLGEEVGGLVDLMCKFRPPQKKSIRANYWVIARTWLTVVPVAALKLRSYTRGNISQISLRDLRNNVMPATYEVTIAGVKQRKHWFYWLEKNASLWQVLNKGSNHSGENSKVKLTFDIQAVLGLIDPAEVYNLFLSEQNPTDTYEELLIDLDNLQTYIASTEQSIPTKSGNYRAQMETNLAEAKMIEALAMGYDRTYQHPLTGREFYWLPQTYRQTGADRRYYTGSIALQRTHHMVREAACGAGYSLDINTSVFAYYQTICDGFGFPAAVLTDYKENKDRFRDDIGSVLANTFPSRRREKVKQCLTAMGFGATEGQFGALSNILVDSDDLEAFNQHPRVQEMRQVIEFVHNILKQHCADQIQQLRSDPAWRKGRGFNYNRFYALQYQEWETEVMQELQTFIQETGGEVVLWVHDGLLMRGKLDKGYQHDIQRKFGQFVTFEQKKLDRYNFVSLDTQAEILSHRARMMREQMRAEGLPVENITDAEWIELAANTPERKPKLAGKRDLNRQADTGYRENSDGEDAEFNEFYQGYYTWDENGDYQVRH